MTQDSGVEFDGIAAHAIPASGRITYVKNADGTYSPAPALSGIAVPYGYRSAGSANQDSQVVKAGATTLFGFALQNTHATATRYVKFYDKATGPTSGDTPGPVYALAPGGGGITRQPISQLFNNGLAFRITTGVADADTGAASAGDVLVNLDYK